FFSSRRRHTRCYRDWSSDVCSSDLLRFASLAIVKIIAGTRTLAHAVLMIQTNVEPDWRVKRAVLVQAKPGQFIVKNFRSFRIREVTICYSPIGDRPRDPMNQLSHRSFSSAFVRIGAVGD